MSNFQKKIKIQPPTKETLKKIEIQASLKNTKEVRIILVHDLNSIKKELDKNNLNTNPVYDCPMKLLEDKVDHEGEWSWGVERNWNNNKQSSEIISNFKRNYINKYWKDIYSEKYNSQNKPSRRKHIHYSVKKICFEAQKRLLEIALDDFHEIFRFRLTGKFRLYGFTCGDTFLVVWHDPEHKIYPIKD
ncbi:hypothetical protein EHO60_03335 [Leptospira fletcheri]|uniref:Uncharacterized protein n=1 Tax=Leptospira fletcheri TaxID=2484981 RepID=A0A4R9GGB5_9LEPT|nr:hypothetical protein [Leptospira fletcheri]TGK11361.1 hypothetical protein EHO60_03335 [Leptospira fletcheri]